MAYMGGSTPGGLSFAVFLICLGCGKAKSIRALPIEGMNSLNEDFKITGHKFEIYGYCQHCDAK